MSGNVSEVGKGIRKKTAQFIIFVIAAVIITAGAAAVIAQSMWNIGKGEYEERVIYGNTLTMQMATNVSTMIHQNWNFAHYASHRAEREQFASESELLQYLKDIEMDSNRQFLFIRKDGHLLKSDGVDVIWPAQNLLITGKDEFYVSDTEMFGNDGAATMYFIIPLDTEITVGDTQYTHLLMAQRLDVLDSFFTLDQSVATGLTFIIRSNGTQIYQKENVSEISNVYNVLAYLQGGNYAYDESYDSLRNDITNGVNNTVRVELDGTNYYLSEYHLDISDWILMILVPENTLHTGGDALADIISKNVIFIYSSIALVVLIIVGSAIFRTIRQQRAVADSLRKAAEAERQASISKTNFLSAMSHDIRTPMNAIVNYTNLAIKKRQDTDFVMESLQEIKVSSDHLLTLINDVLDISRIESGKVAITPVDFDIQKLFAEINEIVEPRCRENHVQLHVNGQFPVRYLSGDTLRLKQIYLNILTNAIKYNVSGGQIFVDVSERTNEARNLVQLTFVCKDTGIGMSEAFQQVMYQEFARETDSRVNQIPGTGLGLAICKQLVDAMQGSIVCESEEQKGTTFTICLELPVASVETKMPDDQTARSESEWKQLLSGRHILVAEDNRMNWNMLHILLQDVGIEAVWVQNGKECVDLLLSAEEDAFDAVLMDVRMPVMDGREASRQIRTSGKDWLALLPIVAVSADAFAEDKWESHAAGMSDHITKPIDASVLYATLLSVIKE